MLKIKSLRWPGQVYCVEQRDKRDYQSVVPKAIADQSEQHHTRSEAWKYLNEVIVREENPKKIKFPKKKK
jgi:hypothetical protein